MKCSSTKYTPDRFGSTESIAVASDRCSPSGSQRVGDRGQPRPQRAQLGQHVDAGHRADLGPVGVLGLLQRREPQPERHARAGQHRQVVEPQPRPTRASALPSARGQDGLAVQQAQKRIQQRRPRVPGRRTSLVPIRAVPVAVCMDVVSGDRVDPPALDPPAFDPMATSTADGDGVAGNSGCPPATSGAGSLRRLTR